MNRGIVLVCVVLISGVACSSKSPTPATPPTESQPPLPAGTKAWAGGALLLPEKSPAVVEGRLSELLDATRRLKKWVVAEPAMLGEEGEETVRAIEVGWNSATAYLGVDPTDDQAWIDRGVDPTRPFFAGLYPIGEEGRKFLASVDTTVRRELEIPAGTPIGPSLKALEESGQPLPEGTNSRIVRSVSEQHPAGGLRVVIPTSSAAEFITTVSSFAEGMGYKRFPPELAAEVDVSPMERAFWSADSIVPAFAVRLDESHAVLDVLFGRFVGGTLTETDPVEDLEAMYADLGEALRVIGPGRPAAPRAYDQPALAVSFDQSAMSEYVRLRGYRNSLNELRSSSAGKRDAALLGSLRRTTAQAQAWEVASDQLTGSTLAVHLGGQSSKRIGRVSMSLFGRADLKRPQAAPRYPTLGISDRSASFGMTVAALRAEAWRSWFAGEVAAELDAMDFEVDPVASIFPVVRAAFVAFGAVGDPRIRSTLFGGFDELLARVDEVARAEVVSLTPDISGTSRTPRLLVAFVLDAEDPVEATTYLREIVVDRTAALHQAEMPPMGPVEPGTTQTVRLGDAALNYRLETVDPPIALFGLDVDIQTLEEELASMRQQSSPPTVMEGRLEPIAMLSWIRLDDPELFDPIDPDILAQRLGPLTVELAPRPGDAAEAVTLDVTLESPPKL